MASEQKGDAMTIEKREVEMCVCDCCGATDTYMRCCTCCGKHICNYCQDGAAKQFEACVLSITSGDGLYCNACLADTDARRHDELFMAFREIALLRCEAEAWKKEFEARAKKAEARLRKLYQLHAKR